MRLERAFYARSVHQLTNRVLPLRAVFGPAGDELAASVRAEQDAPFAVMEEFLRERPLPYPSYEDPDEEIAKVLEAPKYFPMTSFVGADGKTAFIKAGEYTSRAELEADIDRYLG